MNCCMINVGEDTHRVEGSSVDGLVDLVGTRDGVRGKERDDLEGREATSILETLENLGDAVLRLRDEALNSGDGLVGAASQELKLRSFLLKHVPSEAGL